MRHHVITSTSCRQVNISPCLCLQFVTEVPAGNWIRDKFNPKIDRSVKTPWQEYGVVAGSWWWAPAKSDWYPQSFHVSLTVINCTILTVDPGGPLRMTSCDNHYGAQCNFSCAIGYRLNGSSTVTCVAPGNKHPGVWNNTIPICEGKLEISIPPAKLIGVFHCETCTQCYT